MWTPSGSTCSSCTAGVWCAGQGDHQPRRWSTALFAVKTRPVFHGPEKSGAPERSHFWTLQSTTPSTSLRQCATGLTVGFWPTLGAVVVGTCFWHDSDSPRAFATKCTTMAHCKNLGVMRPDECPGTHGACSGTLRWVGVGDMCSTYHDERGLLTTAMVTQ